MSAGNDDVDPDRARMLASGGGAKDPAELVAEVNDRAGCDLSLVGVAEHGESGGAVYVRWPDGREGVVTRSPASLARMRQTAEVLAEARAAGLPVPRHDVVVELDDGVVALAQERLPGAPARRVDADVIDAMVSMNDRFAGLLAGRPDVPILPMLLQRGGSGEPKHHVLENHSARTRRLLHAIHEIGDEEPHEMSGDDLVHPDYTFGNVLYDDRQHVSGVVDWNWGVSRGDRHLALVRIYIDLFWSTLYPGSVDQSASARLDEVVEELIDPHVLRMYWAHVTLGQLSYWIRDENSEAIALFQRFGEHRLSG
ncbi:phosphotransferase [Tenggerimyces flavus]|uniref:Phosphotransferase n=1 Tax=Tenggerimyces flavus TaxID=1708749 RepID=A0ABV7YAP0_9ACTN|nr:phosphotransferase [Tenggerimyces flavus]MBM7785494.1 aminoglycoside phosphotransferase (APT) family kinase protein [Tenggerimyces flavus]